MQKQHHPVTIFFLVVAVIVAGVYIWRTNALNDLLNATVLENTELKQRLERETNTRISAQQELVSLRRAISGQKAALHEFMQRVHVVHDAALQITIEAARTSADSASNTIPVISAELATADGRLWRFMSDYEQQPTTELTTEGAVRMTFRCAPVRGVDIQGRPVAELSGITRLRAPYQPVLGGAGFTVAPESTKEIVFFVDGVEVARTAPTPAAPDAWEYDVTAAFTGLYERYQEQLRSRIAAAAKASTPAE